MKKITINFETFADKEEAHNYLAEQLEFPDYYGKNLDALYECLTEISSPTAVHLVNTTDEYAEQIAAVFADAEEENGNLAVFVN